MDVLELYDLCGWLDEYGEAIRDDYQKLRAVLQHNATQPQKQPVTERLEKLIETLSHLPIEQLTNEQIAVLAHLEIEHLIGQAGAQHVRETVVKSDYDPATAANEIQNNEDTIIRAMQLMQQVGTAFLDLGLPYESYERPEGRFTIRVQFKQDASISDVGKWKKWSTEWHDIVRGIALCVGESPSDTQVIGASKGSLIMILAGTATFTMLLAMVVKHLSSIVKEGLEIAGTIEDLRRKRLLNKAIEDALNDQRDRIKKERVQTIVSEVKNALPTQINGEQENALTKAVNKFLKFSELGGDIDFVSPDELGDEDQQEAHISPQEVATIRETLEQIRSMRDDMKLLTQQTNDNVTKNQ